MKSKLLIIPFVLLISISVALACSCIIPPPPQEAIQKYDQVFVGTVTGIDSTTTTNTYTFSVENKIKGVTTTEVSIESATSSASCGYNFAEGETYIVYANNGQTNLCSRTAQVSYAEDDLRAFGITLEESPLQPPSLPQETPTPLPTVTYPSEPEPVIINQPRPATPSNWAWILIGIGCILVAVLLLALATFLVMRK